MSHADTRFCASCGAKADPQNVIINAEQRIVAFCCDSCREKYQHQDARDREKTDARVY